jgi:hypothetical protein
VSSGTAGHFFWGLRSAGSEASRLTLAWKAEPLPAAYIACVLIGAFAFDIVPDSEKLIRCLKARHPRSADVVGPR